MILKKLYLCSLKLQNTINYIVLREFKHSVVICKTKRNV